MAGHTLGSEELAGDVESFAADDDDLLAVEQLFGDGAGETTEQVTFAVYHNLCVRQLLLVLDLGQLLLLLRERRTRLTTGSKDDILSIGLDWHDEEWLSGVQSFEEVCRRAAASTNARLPAIPSVCDDAKPDPRL